MLKFWEANKLGYFKNSNYPSQFYWPNSFAYNFSTKFSSLVALWPPGKETRKLPFSKSQNIQVVSHWHLYTFWFWRMKFTIKEQGSNTLVISILKIILKHLKWIPTIKNLKKNVSKRNLKQNFYENFEIQRVALNVFLCHSLTRVPWSRHKIIAS